MGWEIEADSGSGELASRFLLGNPAPGGESFENSPLLLLRIGSAPVEACPWIPKRSPSETPFRELSKGRFKREEELLVLVLARTGSFWKEK